MTFLGEFVMERRSGTDAPRAVPALPGPVSAALVLGFAFVLGAGEAAAQNLCAGDVVTGRTTIVVCDRASGQTRNVHINLRNPDIALTGYNESPVTADTYGVGSVTIEVTGGSLSSSGNWAKGIRSWSNGGSGDVAVTVKDVDITTANDNGNAVYVRRQAGTGNIKIDVSGGVLTTTGGGVSQGITGWVQVAGNIDIDAKDVVMRTEGANSLGIFGYQQGPTGDVDVAVQGGSIETNGFLAHGVYSGKIGGTGNADLSVSGASVTTRGRFTRAVNGVSSGEGDVTVDVSGEAVIVAEGEGSVGVYLLHVGNGSVHATIGAETRTEAPFGNGVYGRLMPSANAAGRIVIDARGRIEARDTGILAWAEPRSGSTFGEGNEAADETAGTAPMIHVTSGGDVTVGEGVMDAYIRAVAAGDDETLSAGEQAVLDAIAAGDEDALTTALAALPDDYDDAWKARMRAFRTARGAMRTDHHGSQGNAPGANARLAEAAAVEILDIPRAGIRAMALSHTEIADYVRRGGLGGTLSDDERTVLAAVLTGGDLETALGALPADYTDTWKDGVRLRAMSYNAGDIQVDVTGGTIDSEGDGVHARYVVPHDRNGAITVTVAAGAEITGGRHGIFVGGAGLAAGGGLRDQTVTVNGAVMGGTGAGVHLVGGGTVTVGETGRVGGDIRAQGNGALTLDVQEGGVVTGTVHDPAGPLTVRGSIGRLLYTNGGTVTVAATGELTGVKVEDGTEALRSEAGDLDVTVAGTVAGDLRAPTGGALTLDVQEGGVVTGTVHDPAGPLTVRGSIGRLLYANGGTVTVAATGRLTGVEAEGRTEAIRSEAGDLGVTVAAMGRVTGDLRALGGGDLDATISGTVEGDLLAQGGALTVDVQEGGEVTGTVHDPAGPLTVAGSIGRLLYTNGGTVTVAATGKLTGVEVEGGTEALRSETGDLALTVAGTVAGDLRAPSGGALTVDVQEGGKVTGTVHDPAGPLTVAGSIGRLLYTNGGTVTVAVTGKLTGVEVEGGTEALRSEAGDLDVTVAEMGTVTGDIRGMGAGALSAMVAGTVTGDIIEEGAGDLDATVSGTIEGNVFGRGTGEHTVTVSNGGTVTGTIHLAASTVSVDGTAGRVRFDNGGMVTVGGTGKLTGVEVEGRREAVRSEAGDLDVTVAGMVTGNIRGMGAGALSATVAGTVTGDVIKEDAGDLDATVSGTVEGDVFGRGTGEHTVTVSDGGTVRGTIHLSASTVSVDGTAGRVQFDNGGTVTVAATGELTGIEGGTEVVRSEAGNLDVTVAGTVTGNIRGMGAGALSAMVAGTVTGDIIEEGAGDLDATVSGTIEGNVFGRGTGEHTVTVSNGGTVTGTIHLAASTVSVDGTAGRVRFDNGGMVTVGGTGKLTGVEVEGRREAVRSEAGDLDVTVAGMVTGNIRGMGAGALSATVAGTVTGDVIKEDAGDLDATVSGTVEGDVFGRGTGEHTVTVSDGGTVRGTIHLSASTVSVDGTAGRVQFDNGGTVTVAATGELTGIEGGTEVVRSEAGNLDVTVAGTVTGNIRGMGAGALSAMVAGTVTGDIIEEGAGDLDATVSGTVKGNVFGRGTGEHTVTVSNGGTVTGTIHLSASTVTVDGTAGRVQFDNGGMVTVGPNGQVTGIGGVAVRNAQGELVVLVQQRPGETPFTALDRGVQGAIVVPEGDTPVVLTQREGETARPVGATDTASSAPDGAGDVGVERTETGEFQVVRKLAPRSRLYEALPSVLLGLNAPVRYEERMAAARAEQGGWARVETVHGKWKADASTSQKLSGVELEYDHRRHGLQAGMDVAAGEDGLLGVSLHHRRGSADVSNGGKVELSGHGVGVSGAWGKGGVYVDVQAEATWYEADFTSSLRGVLKQDVSGHGYALGVEAGRRIASGWAGMVLTPRAGLVHSRVFVGGFTDEVGVRVSLEDGRSLKGRAGMVVEVKSKWWAQGSRVFGSVDVERELSKDRKVRVSGTELRSEADATWLRFGLNGSHVLDDGRWTVAGRVGYATSGGSHELGGGLHLKMRF